MAGSREGGLKAARKNLEKNPNFYRDIGRIGGRNGTTGGFAAKPELARIVGAKGGRISKRGKNKPKIEARKSFWQRMVEAWQ
jgi:general stress protein YciG